MRLFSSGLRKLVRRLATWLTFGLLAALLVLILIAVGATANRAGATTEQRAAALTLVTFPAAYGSILSFILGLGGLFAVIYGAAVAGSEWTWGTLKNAVARGESRRRYTLLSFAAIAVVIGVGLLLAFLIGVVAAIVGANLAGVPTTGLNDGATLGRLPEQFARGWLAIIEEGALGFAIAARTQPARRHRRWDRSLLWGDVRRDLPARHRQVPALQRRDRVGLDGCRARRLWGWRRSADRISGRQLCPRSGRRLAHRIAAGGRSLHGTRGDQRLVQRSARPHRAGWGQRDGSNLRSGG